MRCEPGARKLRTRASYFTKSHIYYLFTKVVYVEPGARKLRIRASYYAQLS
jgi:hypothetical protein